MATMLIQCAPHEHQIRQVDTPCLRSRHDRTVRGGSGTHQRVQRETHLLRHFQLRLRCALWGSLQDIHQHHSAVVDPKDFSEHSFVDYTGDVCIIPPNSFALAHTVEYFRIPRNVLTVCLGKSTYARCGIIVNVTPLEPEWEGHVTLEFSNTTPLPAKIYANEGVAQMLFFESDEVCETSYADRGGKYQGQQGVTLPKT